MTAARSDNPFSGAWLDRRSSARAESDWLAAALAEAQTRFVVTSGTRHLVRRAPRAGIAFLDAAQQLVREAQPQQFSLLGWYREARCVLLEVAPEAPHIPADAAWEELRPLLGDLPADQAAILACARALAIWRSRHRHCGVCGAPTQVRNAGHTLKCTDSACASEFFPRIDPAVIVLVSDGERALLGRQASWPPGRYSALAGFVETGESLEDTVRREVREETGVLVESVHYFASQAWPFPASLMLGFHAKASATSAGGGVLTLDDELEDARWFSAAELQGAATTVLPPPFTIARRLIDAWLERVSGAVRP